MTLDDFAICINVSCFFIWLIIFHWFLRRTVERWVDRIYAFFVEDDDRTVEERKRWVSERLGELWARVLQRKSGGE
jgi:hypothetical protein